LEIVRRKLIRALIPFAVVALLATGLFSWYTYSHASSPLITTGSNSVETLEIGDSSNPVSDVVFQSIGFLLFSTPILLVIYFVSHSKKFKAQQVAFKSGIMDKIVKFVDGSLVYTPRTGIQKEDFLSSNLFHQQPDRYSSQDMVSGTLGKTAMRFSQILAEREAVSSGKDKKWKVIFSGLFFIGDFSKNFEGKTFVLPDTAERLFGSLGVLFQKWTSRGEKLVSLENSEFEKLFAVYSTSPVEARYILSSSLMTRITEFRKKTGILHLAFVNSTIFIAIELKKRLFEPPLFKSMVNYEVIEEDYRYMALMAGVIEDLNLNTRIWTKE